MKMNKFRAFGISVAGSLALSAICAQREQLFSRTTALEIFAGLSDAFFVPALLFCGLGLLVRISATGALDIFGYALSSLIMLFSPLRRPRRTYYDYQTERGTRRHSGGFILLYIGGVNLGLTILFYILYARLAA